MQSPIVGVCIRPLTEQEKYYELSTCLSINDQRICLEDLEDAQRHREFIFNHCYDSTLYIDFEQEQKKSHLKRVHQTMGINLLRNALQGVDCILFAYGETNSGKSFHLFGEESLHGIVQSTCLDLLKYISDHQNEKHTFRLNLSMIEIYHERVHDMIRPHHLRLAEGLKIRKQKIIGVYVGELSYHPISSFEDLQQKLKEAFFNRAICVQNEDVFLDHFQTICKLEVEQIHHKAEGRIIKRSNIHFVDLGSNEMALNVRFATCRLKEAVNNGRTRNAFNAVISVLADKSRGKMKNAIVPYRDSCLTRVLQDQLGGKAKMFGIFAVSPLYNRYSQTLSALRIADQMSKIRQNVTANIIDEQQLNQQLRKRIHEQNEELCIFETLQALEEKNDKKAIQQKLNTISNLRELKRQLNRLKIKQNIKIKRQASISIRESLSIQEMPYLTNLNQDAHLDRKIKYFLARKIMIIGKRDCQPANTIEMMAVGICRRHATIKMVQDKLYLQANNRMAQIFVNGQKIEGEVELSHLDRISFASTCSYLLVIPSRLMKSNNIGLNWLEFQYEIYLKKEWKQYLKRKRNQTKRRISASKIAAISQQQQKQKIQQQNTEKQMEINESASQLLMTNPINIEHSNQEYLQMQYELSVFQKELIRIYSWCRTLNFIAKQLHRNVHFFPFVVQTMDQNRKNRTIINVKIIDQDKAYIGWCSSSAQLKVRYWKIRQIYNLKCRGIIIPSVNEDNDSFMGSSTYFFIGVSVIAFKFIINLFDYSSQISILQGSREVGRCQIEICPTDQTGQHNLQEQLDDSGLSFEATQLLNKPFYFTIALNRATIYENYANLSVKWKIAYQYFQVDALIEHGIADFNYRKVHCIPKMTEDLLNQLQNQSIIFKFEGREQFQCKAEQPCLKRQDLQYQKERIVQQQKPISSEQNNPNRLQKSENIQKKSENMSKQKKRDCLIY